MVFGIRFFDGIGVYLIVKDNGGKSDALNAGIDFCNGEYFACIDADCATSSNLLTNISNALSNRDLVALGGRIFPSIGIDDYVRDRAISLKYLLCGYQELEYNKAFKFNRVFFDKISSTLLISGALSVFNKDLVIKLGGYSSNTVGEDMELVMKIRQYSVTNNMHLDIGYTINVLCLSEVPWNIKDLIKQRIRWTVGLSEVLWTYRKMSYSSIYNFRERMTFWYFLLFEKFSPHIELTCFIIYLCCGMTKNAFILLILVLLIELLITIIGSRDSIKFSIKYSNNKLIALFKIVFMLISFSSIYHLIHSIVRLISVPYHYINKSLIRKENTSWNSPKRH